jgi:2-dehydropantoate 2-reductase
VGGYFGGRLAEAGEDVVFLVRGKTLEALRSEGLRVTSPKGDLSLTGLQATDRPDLSGPVDAILFTVKTWQLAAAAESIRPMVGPGTALIPLQNGVESETVLSDHFGPERVLGAICRIIAMAEAPGRINHLGVEPFIALGELDNKPSRRVEELLRAFTSAGVAARCPKNIHAAIWEKFLFVSPTAGVCAVTRAPVGAVRSTAETRQLLVKAMEEVHRLAAARGVSLAGDALAKTIDFFDGLPAAATSSMQRDIMEGRPSELEAHLGATVRLGRQSGVEVPANLFLYASLLPMELAARSGRDR